jgi:preprotein translocase subunit YajC
MIRPQQKKAKAERDFQQSLKPGMRVVTTSGMQARVAQVQDDGVVLETLSGKIKFELAAVSKELTQARFPETADKKDKK